ncbi:uncharacterized protein Hap1MRO34_019941 [Clarias gariepinus]|uniref:APC membrane recruitment protein 2 n=1 Tax=Clarias gariepinus TaxID=13013 RepID=UPI00234C985B|nr:APC membrane recruitment protein 2 [Clarias gariepinus]
MDAQSDSCVPPPCDLQPPGESGLKSPPSRSKTLDGLTDTMGPEAGAESVDLDSHKEDAAFDQSTNMKNNMESISTRQSISSLTSAKSLSFLSMLRRNRKGGGGEREAQTESHRSGQQRKSIKNLFGSVRWHRKDKEEEDEVVPGPPLLASRSNSVEIMKENMTLTPRPARPFADDLEFEHPPSQEIHITPENTNKVSGAAKPLTNDRLSTLLGDISSILNLDSLAGDSDIVADVEAEWIKVSNRVEVEAGRGEAVNVEKALLAPKPTFSYAPTFSSTSSTIPSPTTKLTSSCIPPSITSPTKPIQSLTTEPVTSPVLCPDTFPILSPNIMSVPVTVCKSPPTTPNLIVLPKPTLTITSTPTPEPSPNSSITLFPPPSPAADKPVISITEKFLEPAAALAIINEPTHTPSSTTKPTPAAPTFITRPIQPIAQDTKHISAPVPKYPPFITSTKPLPTAPVIRPKIVTTFGLSTSRNTAPIIKAEPKQSAQQIKLGPFHIEKNGSGTVFLKASPSEPGPPHLAKPLFAANNKPTHLTTSTSTSENPPYWPEIVNAPLPSGSSLLPTLTRTAPNISPCCVPRVEEGQEDVAIPRVHQEGTQPPSSYKLEKNTLFMKTTTFSKIPVSGGGKLKHHQKDAQSNGEERQWNLPTPVHEEETLISPTQQSISKDALNELCIDSEGINPTNSNDNEDMPDSAAHPTIGSVNIPRESRIPIKPGSTPTYHSLHGKTELARSKIPVSKVPIRRTSNKTGSTSTAVAPRK